MLLYIVAYDITCDKRRKKISNLLKGYGQRVQYSVFECQLNHTKFNELRKRLIKVVKVTEDSVRFYPLSQHTSSQVEVMGIGSPVISPPTSMVI